MEYHYVKDLSEEDETVLYPLFSVLKFSKQTLDNFRH